MNKLAIGEVCNVTKGKTGIAKAIPGKYPLVATRSERLSHNEPQFDCKAVCVPLVSSTGHGHASIKRIHYQDGNFALGSILAAITSKDENILDTKFLYIYLSALKDRILVPLMQGTANVTMSVKVIKNAMIDLPSIEKQKEIVKTYQYIFPIWESLTELYEDQQSLINNARKSILQLAVQGKLVQQDPNDEPAAVLLDMIKAEKEILVKEGKIKKSKPMQAIEVKDIPYKLADGWMWVRLGETVLKLTDGTHHSPPNVPTGDFKYVTAKNIKPEGINLANITYVSGEIHNEIYNRCNPEFGDILYIKDGATTGIVTINDLSEPFSMLSSVALLKVPSNVYNRYLLCVLCSPSFYSLVREDMSGIAITRVTLTKLNKTLIPLAPFEEQRRIVAKVDQLMALCDELEEKLNQSHTNGAKLMEAVVAELVGA